MSGAGAWLVQALAASAVLMAAVLLTRRPLRRLMGAEVAYVLWALPALRLILPRLPTAPSALPAERLGETVSVIVDAVPAASIEQTRWPIGPALFAVWLAGAAVLLAGAWLRHRRFCRAVLAAAVPVATVGGVRVVASPAVAGPLAFGVRHRFVALPADRDCRFDADERAMALAHELAHHRRRDLHANWAALVVLAAHWFDPLAWIAFRAFRADQELANDAGMLAGRSAVERHAYARAIVKAVSPARTPAPAACLHSLHHLKRRLHMLTVPRPSDRRLAASGIATALLLAGGLAMTASSSPAAALAAQVSEALPVSPPPPAPAAPPATTAPLGGLHQVKRVIAVRNGKTTRYDTADIDAHLAAGEHVAIRPLQKGSSRMIVKMNGDPDTRIEVQYVPAVRSAQCGIGTGAPTSMVVDAGKGAKRAIVICTDRIAAATQQAAHLVVNVPDLEANARASARAGLVTARAAIMQDRALTDAQRAEALAGIAQAERELAAQVD